MNKKLMPLVGAVLLLTACSGGNDDSQTQAVPLQTRADALRELGVLISVVGTDDGEADSSAKRAGTTTAAGLRKGPARTKSTAVAKATQTENCDSGTRTITDGSIDRSFEFFAVQRTVSFERTDADSCSTEGPIRFTIDGIFEDGASAVDANGSSYSYSAFGADGNAVAFRFEPSDSDDPASFVDGQLTSLAESTERNGMVETRTVGSASSFGYSTARGDIDAAITVGRNGDPLIDIEGNGSQTLDGPYSYSSDRCSGGALRVDTLSPLRFDNYMPRGGSLRLTSGDIDLIYTFNADGSAALRFANGSSDTLTSAEVEDIYLNDSYCVDN